MTITGDLSLHFGNLSVTYYGLCIVLGIASAGIVAFLQIRRHKLDGDLAMGTAAIGGIGAIVGAKLLYLATTLPHIPPAALTDATTWVLLFQGGFVFYGGLLGALAAMPLAKRLLGIDLPHYLAALSPCIPLGHAFGRLGCLLAGCCYGAPTDGLLHVTYLHSTIAPNNLRLFPIQLIEAICCIAIFLTLLVYINHFRRAHGLELYCFLYACCRFWLEFLRYDTLERGLYGIFSTSQWISIGIIVTLVCRSVIRSDDLQPFARRLSFFTALDTTPDNQARTIKMHAPNSKPGGA